MHVFKVSATKITDVCAGWLLQEPVVMSALLKVTLYMDDAKMD